MALMTLKLNENLYLRDPQNTELGQNILQQSVKMIDQLGFEQFTFKKLAEDIGSTEASVYRYFENKHRLLLYLIDWYWTWLEHRMDFSIQNVKDPKERMHICIGLLAEEKKFDPSFAFIHEPALQRITIGEFDKAYLTKQVDADNKEGLFLPYKSICKKIAGIVLEINPKYEHSHTLVSTMMLAANHQIFYAQHLPSLTDIKIKSRDHYDALRLFMEELILTTITKKR